MAVVFVQLSAVNFVDAIILWAPSFQVSLKGLSLLSVISAATELEQCIGSVWHSNRVSFPCALCRCMGQPLPPPRGLLAAGQLLNMEQERQKAMLRALSAGSGSLAGINLAAVGLAGARSKLGISAAQEAKLRCAVVRPATCAGMLGASQPDTVFA